MEIRIKHRISYIICICIFVLICSTISCKCVHGSFIAIDMGWIFLLWMFTLAETMSLRAHFSTKAIILFGVLLRCGMCFLAEFLDGTLPGFIDSPDQKGFLSVAEQYFNGNFIEVYTRFPFFIFLLFQVFGPSGMMIRFFNILLWFLGIKLIEYSRGNLFGREAQYLICFYCLMTFWIILIVSVLRESVMSFLMMLSVCFLFKWMDRGQKKDIIWALICSLPAILLHGGNVVILVVIYMVCAQWCVRTKKWRIFTQKNLLLTSGMIFVLVCLWSVFAGSILKNYPIWTSWQLLTNYSQGPARADYMNDYISVTSVGQFVYYTLYRSIFFWISPTPNFWNTPQDILGFLADSIPWIIFFLFCLKDIICRKLNAKALVGIYVFLAFTFVYGWGTRNAGTAMRHRDMLLGMLVMIKLLGHRPDLSIKYS